MSKIIFKNPFEANLWEEKNFKKNSQCDYICAKCLYNKTGYLDEDLGCILNERVPGDTVSYCGFFKENISFKKRFFKFFNRFFK